MRTENGGYRATYSRHPCIEVDRQETAYHGIEKRIAASGAEKADFGLVSSVPKWRATADEDGHYSFAVTL